MRFGFPVYRIRLFIVRIQDPMTRLHGLEEKQQEFEEIAKFGTFSGQEGMGEGISSTIVIETGTACANCLIGSIWYIHTTSLQYAFLDYRNLILQEAV